MQRKKDDKVPILSVESQEIRNPQPDIKTEQRNDRGVSDEKE